MGLKSDFWADLTIFCLSCTGNLDIYMTSKTCHDAQTTQFFIFHTYGSNLSGTHNKQQEYCDPNEPCQ